MTNPGLNGGRAMLELAELAFRPFRGDYAVADDGTIWSCHTGSWVRLKPTLSEKGYGRVTLILGGIRKDMRLNRIVAEAWHGPPPFSGAVARHLDDDRSNNCPENIAWGSVSDNTLDALRNGRVNPAANGRAGASKISGERGPMAKLSWEVVRDIRRRAATGENNCDIARALGLDRSNVSLIVRGKTWKETEHV